MNDQSQVSLPSAAATGESQGSAGFARAMESPWRDRLRDAEHEVISAVARGPALHDILALACRRFESLVPSALCSVLLLDETRTTFTLGAAPSLPASYNDALEGLAIGPDVGACGTAAHTLRTVVCGDIATDPKWAPFRALAQAHGLAACWSIPLVCAANRPLGTFAVYHRRPHWPEAEEIAVATVLSDAVAVAISRHWDQQALIKSRDELEARVADRTRELQQATNDAVRTNAFKTRFLAAASHDLRQPLQAASAFLEALALSLSGAPRAAAERARAPLQAMDSILNSLLDISRFEGGDVTPEIRDVDLDDVIRRSLEASRAEAANKDLRLTAEAADAVVRSDPALLERVLDNLIANAVRYTAAGEVTVRVSRRGDGYRVSVCDTGIGIPPEKLEVIFEEYVQLDNPARDRRKGLGFGLAFVKLIAKTLRMPIAVNSTVGVGSCFAIDLPPGVASMRLVHRPPPTAPDGPRAQVLLVEDDPDCAFALREYLNAVNFDVAVAANGDDAVLMVVQGLRPQFIISDYRLPRYDGIEVIRRLRASLRVNVPAVLLSGDTSLDAEDVAGLGLCTFMRKPARLEDLNAMIRDLTAARV